MVKHVTVTGWSNSGKTTVLVEVVKRLTDAGINVGVIKHHGHVDDGVDVPGKDSWKYSHAGASPVILSSSMQYAIFKSTPQREATREELIAEIADEVDMVIVEGFRSEAEGAVEVSRVANCRGLKLNPEERIALITDNEEFARQVAEEGKPVFALDDFDGLARYFAELCDCEFH
jgi:molybdopterin-guanine dinucleotide biosynthesis protein MobB